MLHALFGRRWSVHLFLTGAVGSKSFILKFTPLTAFPCHYSSHQALLRRDDSSGLFHPAPAAWRQHGWHLSWASLSPGHQPGANHSAQHQHNLHHRWVWQIVSLSCKFVVWQLLRVTVGSQSESQVPGGRVGGGCMGGWSSACWQDFLADALWSLCCPEQMEDN